MQYISKKRSGVRTRFRNKIGPFCTFSETDLIHTSHFIPLRDTWLRVLVAWVVQYYFYGEPLPRASVCQSANCERRRSWQNFPRTFRAVIGRAAASPFDTRPALTLHFFYLEVGNIADRCRQKDVSGTMDHPVNVSTTQLVSGQNCGLHKLGAHCLKRLVSIVAQCDSGKTKLLLLIWLLKIYL